MTTRPTEVFALLKNERALDVWTEAGSEATSSSPVVRSIIDNGLGFVALGTSHPQDETQERIIRLHTTDPERATTILSGLSSVVKVAPSFQALTHA